MANEQNEPDADRPVLRIRSDGTVEATPLQANELQLAQEIIDFVNLSYDGGGKPPPSDPLRALLAAGWWWYVRANEEALEASEPSAMGTYRVQNLVDTNSPIALAIRGRKEGSDMPSEQDRLNVRLTPRQRVRFDQIHEELRIYLREDGGFDHSNPMDSLLLAAEAYIETRRSGFVPPPPKDLN